MAKKCIPGLFCIENMTMFLLFVVSIILVYLYYANVAKPGKSGAGISSSVVMVSGPPLANIAMDPQRLSSWSGPLPPPEGPASMYEEASIRHSLPIPTPVATRGYPSNYSPIGVLARTTGSGDMVMPLMGRPSVTGRNNYQYYTMTTTGNLNTRLPVSVNGKSCTSEYGCGEISNGDVIYVDGLNDTFRATIYENDMFSYVPSV